VTQSADKSDSTRAPYSAYSYAEFKANGALSEPPGSVYDAGYA